MQYENKFILWLDILGFKNYIKKSISEPHLIQVIAEAIDAPKEFEYGMLDLLDVGDIALTEYQITSFSDTIVLSTEASVRGFLYIANYYIKAFTKLEREGIFCRGSFTYGLIYHSGNKFFGPGVIEACSLEKEAIYPRVQISRSVIEKINDLEKAKRDFLFRFIQLDDVPFLHALFRYRNVVNEKHNPVVYRMCLEFFHKINLNIISCMKISEEDEKTKIIEKYKWLNNYFERITCFKNHKIEEILNRKVHNFETDIYDYSRIEI